MIYAAELTQRGLQALQNIAQRYQMSIGAACTTLEAVSALLRKNAVLLARL